MSVKNKRWRFWQRDPKPEPVGGDAPAENAAQEDNVIEIPQPDEAERKKKHKRKIRRIVLLSILGVIALFVLLVVLFPDLFDFDRVKRYFHYLGKRDKDGYGSISFDAKGASAYGSIGDGFVLTTDGGAYLFDMYGEQDLMVQGVVSEPRILANSEIAVCYSMNGSFFAVIGKDGQKLLDKSLSGTILDVDLSSDGYICYNTTQSGYKTVTTVLNRSQEVMYRFNSSTQFLSACAVAPGGKLLAVAGLSEKDSAFNATVTILRTDEVIEAGEDKEKTSLRRVELGNRTVYDMAFLSSDRLCVITEDGICFLSAGGELLSTYEAAGSYLRGYAFGGKEFVAVLFGEGKNGDRCELVTLDKNGDTLGSIELSQAVRSLSACGKYLAVLTDGEAVIYTKKIKQYASFGDTNEAFSAVMRKDGTLLLVNSDTAKLYFP